MEYFKHESAYVDTPCSIGKGTKIWHFCHIQSGAQIGDNCILGQNCYVDGDARIGSNVKVQNNVSIYSGVVIEDDVFLGPSCVFTNVSNPRAQVNRHSIYERTILRRGCTIGANATILCGMEIGRYAFIAAGSLVTANVPDYALVMGIPARQRGWMSRHGHKLTFDKGLARCPESGLRYQLNDARVSCLDLAEEDVLPESLKQGTRSYSAFKNQ